MSPHQRRRIFFLYSSLVGSWLSELFSSNVNASIMLLILYLDSLSESISTYYSATELLRFMLVVAVDVVVVVAVDGAAAVFVVVVIAVASL